MLALIDSSSILKDAQALATVSAICP